MAQDVDLGHLDARQVKSGHRDAFHPHSIADVEVIAGRFEVQMRACGVVLHENRPAALHKADDGGQLDGQLFQTTLVGQRADGESRRELRLSRRGEEGKQEEQWKGPEHPEKQVMASKSGFDEQNGAHFREATGSML